MRDQLAIAYGASRQAKIWVNKTISFDDLKDRLKTPIRTPESAEEYAKMGKAQRDQVKDKGGFVPAALKKGSRRVDSVEFRSMIALDGDSITKEFLDDYENVMPYASCLYSTHSFTPENPRVRIVIPMTRDASPDEFVAVSRYVAQDLGIDQFDECSYLPNQLMYWPSCPANGVFVYKETDGAWLDPDKVLSAHPEWTDPTRLPTSSRESKANTAKHEKAADPLTKEGVVGTFNRTFYPITKAIDKFLPDVYEPTDNENRWHYTQSHSMAGLEILDEGRYAYSHHAKDPAYLRLCNAFDLVRIHRFGDLDEKESFRQMCDLAVSDEEVKLQIADEKAKQAAEEFSDAGSDGWKKQLEYQPKSMILKNTLRNILLILQNDPNLKSMRYNEFSDGMEIENAPWKRPVDFKYWREADDAQLTAYIDSNYGEFSVRNMNVAVAKVCDDRSYHPVRDYFGTLPEWDGETRLDTLFIKCFGAADNPYVRSVTRKTFVGAVARIMKPGCKFDTMLVLNGFQGQKKSSLLRRLCGDWFSDDISFAMTRDKTAAENIQGSWIIEFSEMTGMRKAEIESIKAFISRQSDKYRAAYGKRSSPHPRQCIFIGTTNAEDGFLRDTTGNRRYWPVKTYKAYDGDPAEISDEFVAQFWAEALYRYNEGEKVYLDDLSILKYAELEQKEAMETDDREGFVQEYLDTLLPENWNEMGLYDRRNYLDKDEFGGHAEGKVMRTRVCAMEIWCECFGRERSQFSRKDSSDIALIMAKMPGWKKLEGKQRFGMYGIVRGYERTDVK